MLRIGLIGCGYIANKHLKTMVRYDDIVLTAVSDIQQDKMEAAVHFYQENKKTKQAVACYKNYQDMLRDPGVDAVVIAVISGLHAEIAKTALKHGMHIMVEKPLALSLQDTDEIIALSERRRRVVHVCHQLRYRPLIQEVKHLIEKGYLGERYLGVISLRLHRPPAYYSAASWKGTWEQDGGMLVNQGIHMVDLLIWLMGDVDTVYGEIATNLKQKETEDVATGIITFKNKAKGVIEANTITQPENLGYYLSIFGAKGSICIGGRGFNEVEYCYLEDDPQLAKSLEKHDGITDEHERMYHRFQQAITEKQPSFLSAKEAKKALEAIFAIYQSDKNRRPVTLPLTAFSTKDMLDRPHRKEERYD